MSDNRDTIAHTRGGQTSGWAGNAGGWLFVAWIVLVTSSYFYAMLRSFLRI